MGKIAFVFSGQGDQHSGMGKELYSRYPTSALVFHMCEELREGTMRQCFEGTEEELKETKNTQPCLFAYEMAATAALKSCGVTPLAVAGFSLGEVSAATVAGMFGLETGFRLVCRRGELMQREAEKYDTSMAAVVKLEAKQVEELCEKYSGIFPVNYNCPGQISVSGLTEQMSEFSADVKNAGGRAIPLKVKGAFHSPFMNDAAAAFEEELKGAEINHGSVTLYSNVTAEPYTDDVTGLLSRQICNPVKWEKIIRAMLEEGVDTFIEIGPGKTLSNMIKKTSAEAVVYTVEEYLQEVASC